MSREDRTADGLTREEWIARAKQQSIEDLSSAVTYVLGGMLAAKRGDLEKADHYARKMQQHFEDAGHVRTCVAVYELTEHLLCELSAKLGGLEAVEYAIRNQPPGTVFAEWTAEDGRLPDGDGK